MRWHLNEKWWLAIAVFGWVILILLSRTLEVRYDRQFQDALQQVEASK